MWDFIQSMHPRKKCHVVAFEPSVFNLELLTRNLQLNALHHQVTLLPLALRTRWAATLRLTSLSGEHYHIWCRCGLGWAIHSTGLCLPYLWIEHGSSSGGSKNTAPHFIKMDVDGIEHYLLRGGRRVLKDSGILVEINDDFRQQSDSSKELLEKAGLTLLEKDTLNLLKHLIQVTKILIIRFGNVSDE